MLASLTPFAEAARGNRWTVTAISVLGRCRGWPAPAAGLLWSGLGSLLPGGQWRTIAAAAVLAVALLIDATPLRRRLPLTKRQVNEDWMVTYRGWVYGIGFGAQLGLGFITLVACAAIYATFAIELLSGSLLAGVVIGAAFGATKAASLLPAGRARDRNSIVALHRRLLTARTAERRRGRGCRDRRGSIGGGPRSGLTFAATASRSRCPRVGRLALRSEARARCCTSRPSRCWTPTVTSARRRPGGCDAATRSPHWSSTSIRR